MNTSTETTLPDTPAHMTLAEAATRLMDLAKDIASADDVTALEMGARRLSARHFQRCRNHARHAAHEFSLAEKVGAE